VQIETHEDGSQVIALVKDGQVQTLSCNVLLLLMDKSDGSLAFTELATLHQQIFHCELTVDDLKMNLRGLVQVC